MKKLSTLAILAGILVFTATGAWAAVITPNDTTGEFEIYQAVNALLGTNTYTSNAQLDSLEYTGDTSTWIQTVTNTQGSAGYALIGLGAGNSNELGTYAATNSSSITYPFGTSFSGNLQGPTYENSSTKTYYGVGANNAGTPFGLALNSSGTIWYSNSTLNSDSMDHMLVYDLSSLLTASNNYQLSVYDTTTGKTTLVTLDNPFLIAFEDTTKASSDLDYNDSIYLISGACPSTDTACLERHHDNIITPEPNSGLLLGFGLFALAGFALRRKFIV